MVSEELCEILELGTVYDSFIYTRQRRGTRMVVPKVLRDKVVRLAHESHQRVVKTKYRLQSKMWYPGIDKDVKNLCKVCHGCQATSSCDPPDPMSSVLSPSAPWQDCSADFVRTPTHRREYFGGG